MTMNITVIGTDYEGLTISVGLATLGHKVSCVDISGSRARHLQRGMSVDGDSELSTRMKLVLREGYLRFLSEPEECLAKADIVIIAEVRGAGNERTAILRTAECLSGAIASYSTVLVTAAVPPGTCRILQDWLNDALYTSAAHVVANPVFLEKPYGLEQFTHPERIVLGYESEKSRRSVDELFARMLLSDPMVTHVSWEAAEMMRSPATPFAPAVPGGESTEKIPENAVEDAAEKIYVKASRS